MAELHGLKKARTQKQFAEKWRPFRIWSMALIRVAGDRGLL